jgi:hypothetical protein
VNLGHRLSELVFDLEAENANYFKDIRLWWEWYEGVPLTPRRADPWDGASNVVVPLIRIHADGISARTENTIFAADDLWTARTWNDSAHDIAHDTARFINWGADDNEFDIYTPSSSWINELTVLGSSVIGLNWTRNKRMQFVPGEGGRPTPTEFTTHQGPCFTHIPREQILWKSAQPLAEAESVFTQHLSTRSDLAMMEQFGAIDPGTAAKCKPTSFDYTNGIRAAKRRMAGQDQGAYGDLYDIRQAWVQWPVLRGLRFDSLEHFDFDAPLLPLLVTFDYTTATVLRVQGKPYYTAGWPFYEGQFRAIAGRDNPGGIAKMLEHMQRATTIICNQDIATFKELPLNKLITPDMTLMNAVFAMAERLTGINDPGLGREMRMGGHPAPATSTAMLLQQSQETLGPPMRRLRLAYSRMAEDLVTLYQQFETGDSGKITRALGKNSMQAWQFVQGPPGQNMTFDLKCMDEHQNPDTSLQRAMQVMQMTSNYWGQIINMVAMAPRLPPPAQQMIPQFITAYTEAAKQVLDAGLVDEVDKFILQMKESQFGAANALSGLNALAGAQLAGAPGQPSLPPLPTGIGGVPVAPNGAPITGGTFPPLNGAGSQ